MNKAFVRESEFDGRAYCPKCGSLGNPVTQSTLDHHVPSPARNRLGDSAWFCDFGSCEIAYFDLFEQTVLATELRSPVYPKCNVAPICACFGFRIEDIEADLEVDEPVRIRELLEKSKSGDARCQTLAADGRCCMRVVQRLYMAWRQP